MKKEEMETKMVNNEEQEKALQEERQRRINTERVLRHAAQGLRAVLLVSFGPGSEIRGRGDPLIPLHALVI